MPTNLIMAVRVRPLQSEAEATLWGTVANGDQLDYRRAVPFTTTMTPAMAVDEAIAGLVRELYAAYPGAFSKD